MQKQTHPHETDILRINCRHAYLHRWRRKPSPPSCPPAAGRTIFSSAALRRRKIRHSSYGGASSYPLLRGSVRPSACRGSTSSPGGARPPHRGGSSSCAAYWAVRRSVGRGGRRDPGEILCGRGEVGGRGGRRDSGEILWLGGEAAVG